MLWMNNGNYFKMTAKRKSSKLNKYNWCNHKLIITFHSALHGLDDSDRMLMPTLDKVYKPLVRQQDILARQLCLVKALEKSLDAIKPHLNQTKYGKSLLSKNVNKNRYYIYYSLKSMFVI